MVTSDSEPAGAPASAPVAPPKRADRSQQIGRKDHQGALRPPKRGTNLAAKKLFLRNQLAFSVAPKVRPRRLSDANSIASACSLGWSTGDSCSSVQSRTPVTAAPAGLFCAANHSVPVAHHSIARVADESHVGGKNLILPNCS